MVYNKTGIKCPALTAKGIPCPIDGEKERNNWCHVHDPEGDNQIRIKQMRILKAAKGGKTGLKNKKILAKEQQLKEAIALEVEGQCYTFLNNLCKCDFHKSAEIIRNFGE